MQQFAANQLYISSLGYPRKDPPFYPYFTYFALFTLTLFSLFNAAILTVISLYHQKMISTLS